ncbi:HAMP domain-containing sensor histidine kinase [Clostridium ihumii]|uniref:HAMP domain-containing sensor histidine kinase n=1 Tax=Clostridium ihumii TaxID=1470356 RepID=UPI00058ABF21|nr:HAMP domain-containing sensor histidine kinase [Clostridium ihumii]
MRKNKTLKRQFYILVLKVCMFTAVASIATYIALFSWIAIDSKGKYADYYVSILDDIEGSIKNNESAILDGNIIDLNKYNKDISGEVVDINGKHLYGENKVLRSDTIVINNINQEEVVDNYVYRYVPIRSNNSIKGVYVLKAPFGYVINNFSDRPVTTIVYMVMLFTPLIYFALFLVLFTSKLYKYMANNINVLLNGAESVSNGNFNFEMSGIKGFEFSKIQDAFNVMINTIKENIDNLTKLDNERRMMVSSIAHDIRTPITVIKTQLELVDDLKDRKDFNMDKHSKIINKNCDRMTMLTDNLSLLYKVENTDFLLKNENIDLKKLLYEKITEVKYEANKNNIEVNLETNLEKDNYMLDESMIIRVLNNIIYNSLRFTKQGEINISVYSEDDKINFKCSDTGSGFKQKDTEKLFTAFYQDEDYKNHFGLGLYIAKKIVNNYNGEIKAYNNLNGGATVEFYIKELNNIKV